MVREKSLSKSVSCGEILNGIKCFVLFKELFVNPISSLEIQGGSSPKRRPHFESKQSADNWHNRHTKIRNGCNVSVREIKDKDRE